MRQKISHFLSKNNYLNAKLLGWLVVIYFPIFLNLGGVIMQKWDEARYAASSYEMLHGDNPFVVTYFFKPAFDSAKPPLLHWLQAFFIGLLGFDETSVRLPSALAGLAVCLGIMYVSLKNFKSFSLGAISTLILLSTLPEGFCGMDHSIRTADYEGLLTGFSFAGLVAFYHYNNDPSRGKLLLLAGLCITCAVLTKAAAGLFFLPGMALYLLIKRNLRTAVRSKWFYISAAIFLLVTAFIFLIREYFTPGYLQALNEMELLGRHSTVKDGHSGEYWFYLAFLRDRFDWFFWVVLLGWVFGLASTDRRIRDLSLFTFVTSATFMLVLISSRSKLNWYSFPLYPLLALQGGLFMWQTLKFLSTWLAARTTTNRVALFYLSVVLIFAVPYMRIVGNSDHKVLPDGLLAFNNLQLYMKQEREPMRNAILVSTYNDTEGHYLFYYYKCNERGFNLRYHSVLEEYHAGDKLIIEDPVLQEVIERNYEVDVIDGLRHLKVYLVKGRKNP